MSKHQTILSIDTAMNGCSVAVYAAEQGVNASKTQPMVRGQAEALMPLIEAVMEEARLGYDALNAIITTRGPGAFTGLRIGLSTAKSLALALNIPVLGISTLHALALEYVQTHAPSTRFSVLIETKREDFYAQVFEANGEAASDALAAPAIDLIEHIEGICIGDAIERFQTVSGLTALNTAPGFTLPNPLINAQVFVKEQSNAALFSNPVEPLYLRPPDVSLSKKPQRVIAQT